MVSSMNIIQEDVTQFVGYVWGEEALDNKGERMRRFFEEAVELIQSGGIDREMAHKIVDIVYDKLVNPNVGEEAGQVIFVLAALTRAFKINLAEEYTKVWIHANTPERIAKLRENQKIKLAKGI